MRKTIATVLILAASAVAQAETSSHARLLLHSVNHKVAGWVVAPNISSSPKTWLTVVGGRFSGNNWWLEVMPGFVISDGTRTELIDIRAKLPSVVELTPWLNAQWVDFSKGTGGAFYGYLEVERPLLPGLVNLGLETENTFKPRGQDDWSAGVHLNVALSRFNVIFSYQWHNGPNRLWVRVPIQL